MFDTTGRRRFLELAGTGTALSLAGCNGLQAPRGTESGDGGVAGGAAGDDVATVTVAIQPNSEALQQRGAEIRSQLESGNMTRSEAQRAYQEAQTSLLNEAVATFEGRAGENDALDVEDTVTELGAVLVTGGTAALIGTLSAPEVQALLPRSAFEKARSRAGTQGPAQATSTPS
ncbi:MAG: hypothetical protein ABEH78_01255 [Haloferacaceae archaeon]